MISASNEQLQQQLEYTLLKPDCHSWWISKMQSGREDTLEERYAINSVLNLEKNATETYGMLQTAFRPSCMYRASVFWVAEEIQGFGWLLGFYGISTFVGYSTPNSVYIYIHIQPKISKRILRWVKFSIRRISFVCSRSTSFKLSYFLVQLCLSQERQKVIYFDILEQIG